ncbi:hypothetical protein OKW30_003512 [Paraburkholderia sp. Clong3]|uniref:Z1 domain-containing protein n=1 Tax=Paraburkholderia sp. Clong3 TaxID=2991061 RepID=UPI003D1D499F
MAFNDESKQRIISIAQNLISAKVAAPSQINPTMVEEQVSMAVGLLHPEGLDETHKQAVVYELIRRFSSWIGKDTTLVNAEGHVAWLNSARKKGWRYWERYRQWSERKMSDAAIKALDDSTDRVLGNLEDPQREGRWDRRGLVVGHVQSGKTGNYTGLVCKAADAGYKVIIILAGMHNNLRSQTQIRLEEGFLGHETAGLREMGQLIGVGLINGEARIQPQCATRRADSGDFNRRVAKHLAISPEERPWLFVVKKNKSVLDTLIQWINARVADSVDSSGRKFVSSLPLLVIDDEADHASVDTGEQLFDADGNPDEDYQPKVINSRIRKLLNAFEKAAYVGYTATPFANIFIHRSNWTTDEGEDLFPSSFITNLAAPSNYIGPARMFGLLTTEGRVGGLGLTRYIEDHFNEDTKKGWMPPKHDGTHVPLHKGSDTVPPSLIEAIHSFTLACAARVCRGQGKEHCSMLIHVTRLNNVQKEVHRQVDALVRDMTQRLSRKIGQTQLVADLKALWESDFVPQSEEIREAAPDLMDGVSLPTWEQVLAALPDSLADIKVRMINGLAKEATDYIEHEGVGLKVITIGGEKLARGLTLEGLCTSYFVRTTKMYDTLMQMGRWFGYRPAYVDLCRLYTTPELVEWFCHIADAAEELRLEFDLMAESGETPREYGLKVLSHPVLMVTSPLKMRSSKTLHLSFSGQVLETVALHSNKERLQQNLNATKSLLSKMGAPASDSPRKNLLWRDIPGEDIVEFFNAYSTHREALKVNSAMLSEFITSMMKVNELTTWTVVLMGGGEGDPYDFGNGIMVSNMLRRKGDDSAAQKGRYSIGRLLSPSDEALDLDQAAWEEAMKLTLQSWSDDPGRRKDGTQPKKPEIPSGLAIRKIRGDGVEGVVKPSPENGLLLLYPLDPKKSDVSALFDGWDAPIMAVGVSFPKSHSDRTVAYDVDHRHWENYGPAD